MMIYFTRSRLGGTYIYIYTRVLILVFGLRKSYFFFVKKNSHVLRQDEL